ncbi:hypothetical protein B0H14DRAFT_2924659 [Mycena olivaceomarginata]|nr:hypothetical protein B0H14DRAFT_2924659 [Mycena olivaceomarginata]
MSDRSQQPGRVFVLRRKRTDVACQNCRRRKVKCIPSGDPLQDPCERCTKKGLDCQHVGVGTEEDDEPERTPPPHQSASHSSAPHSPVDRLLPKNRDGAGRRNTHPLQVQSRPNSTPPLAHVNPTVPGAIIAPRTPPYSARPGRDDQYLQRPAYGGGQNPTGLPHRIGYTSASSSLNTNSYPAQMPYIQTTTANDNSGYNCRPAPTNNFLCTCPCYCGGIRR